LSLTLAAHGQLKITTDHNSNVTATSAFKFKNVPSLVKDDAAAKAKLLLLDGEIDPNGADLNALRLLSAISRQVSRRSLQSSPQKPGFRPPNAAVSRVFVARSRYPYDAAVEARYVLGIMIFTG